jgi:hypothetical protein
MLKKISTGSNAGKPKTGDYIFDGPEEENARRFKIKGFFFGCLIAFHGGDFPSVKFISKEKLVAGGWWVKE